MLKQVQVLVRFFREKDTVGIRHGDAVQHMCPDDLGVFRSAARLQIKNDVRCPVVVIQAGQQVYRMDVYGWMREMLAQWKE